MKTVTVETVKRPVLQIATGAGGAMLSKVIAPYVPGGAPGKIGLAIGLGVLAAISTGKGPLAKAGQAAAIGGGVVQLVEGATQLIAPAVAKWADAGEPSKLKELVKRSVGLAAADSSYFEEQLYTGQGQRMIPQATAYLDQGMFQVISEPAGV